MLFVYSGKTLLCAAPPPLIAICRPYLEPARFAHQSLSVEIPFYSVQISIYNQYIQISILFSIIIDFVNFYQGRSIPEQEIVEESAYIFVVLLEESCLGSPGFVGEGNVEGNVERSRAARQEERQTLLKNQLF